MKSSVWRQVGSHVAALAIGMVFALATRRSAEPDLASSVEQGVQRMKSGWNRTADGFRQGTGLSPGRAEECREAWEQLLQRAMSREEKQAAAIRLLERWADADLNGALAAAVAANRQSWATGSGRDLLVAFEPSMKDKPEAFLPILEKHTLGLDTSSLASKWGWYVGTREPMLVLSHLDRLPPSKQVETLGRIMKGSRNQPEQLEAIRSYVGSLPDTPINRRLRELVEKQPR